MGEHLRVGEQHGIRSGDVLAVDEQPAIAAPFDGSDGPRQALGIVDDVEALSRRAQVAALEFGVEGLAVREHQQVRATAATTTSETHCALAGRWSRSRKATAISRLRLMSRSVVFHIPRKGISTNPVSRLPNTQPSVFEKEGVAGLGADPLDIVRINAHTEREQDPHEHRRDERHGECQGHAVRQLTHRCGVRQQDRDGFKLPEQQEHGGTAEGRNDGHGAEPGLEIPAAIHLSRHDPGPDRETQQEPREDERKGLGGRQPVGREDAHPQHLVTQADKAGEKQEDQHVGVRRLLACRGMRGYSASLAQRNDQGDRQVAADGDHQRADHAEVPHEHKAS